MMENFLVIPQLKENKMARKKKRTNYALAAIIGIPIGYLISELFFPDKKQQTIIKPSKVKDWSKIK